MLLATEEAERLMLRAGGHDLIIQTLCLQGEHVHCMFSHSPGLGLVASTPYEGRDFRRHPLLGAGSNGAHNVNSYSLPWG